MAASRDSTTSPPPTATIPIEPARRGAQLTISTDAIVKNWRFFASLGSAEASAVIKADAYGMSAPHAARALAAAGCRTFFVATLNEALEARAALGQGPRVLVLSGVEESAVAAFTAAQLEPVINTHEQMQFWDGPFTLHVDTGMNRLGLPLSQLWAIERAPAMMMSHLACAAAPAHPLNETQRLRFIEACARFPSARRSLAASAGALLGPNFAFDMLRPGIGLYGGGPFDAENPPLAPVATLQAPILQLRDIGVGETIGYGATYSAPARARIATCAIGYADGLLRSLSGKGYGYLRGTACPFRGRVSMDLVTLDVSGVRDVRVGEQAEFLGQYAALDDVARAAGTIPYEILTTLGAHAKAAGARTVRA